MNQVHQGKSQSQSKLKLSSNKKPMHGKGNPLTEDGNMDKIRDILFGNQAKDYEKRFAKIEMQFAREAGSLREELLKRIDALEDFFKQEIKDINVRIKGESNARLDSQKGIQKELKERFESLNKKLVQEEENLAAKSTELREQILRQSKQLSEEILSKSEHASKSLKQTARELDDAKVNISDLSGFFLELSMRLSASDSMGPVENLEE